MSKFEQASREWEIEVDHEAAALVERGFAPWEALVRAKSIVSAR